MDEKAVWPIMVFDDDWYPYICHTSLNLESLLEGSLDEVSQAFDYQGRVIDLEFINHEPRATVAGATAAPEELAGAARRFLLKQGERRFLSKRIKARIPEDLACLTTPERVFEVLLRWQADRF